MKHKAQPNSVDQEQIANPHDRFLKHTLEDLNKVKGTLEGILPSDLFNRLDLDSLKKEDTSYIDNKLKQFFSDIVFSCRTKEKDPLKIAFLFEHKSLPPKYPHLQLLRYMLEIWDREAKDSESLSLVLPILIYHGKEAWNYQPFKEFFTGKIEPELAGFVPLFDFITANLQAVTYAQINEQFHLPSLRIAFRLMKSIRDKGLPEKMENIFEGLSELKKEESGRKYFETIVVYLYYAVKKDKQKVMENMYQISQEASEYADSIAMDLIRKGREEAKLEALKEAQKIIEAETLKAKKLLEEERKRLDEAKQEIFEAKQRAVEAKKRAVEDKRRAVEDKKRAIEEAKQKTIEAKQKAEEVKQKAENAKKKAIKKMLKADMKKELIADFLDLNMKKLNSYIKEIKKAEKDQAKENN